MQLLKNLRSVVGFIVKYLTYEVIDNSCATTVSIAKEFSGCTFMGGKFNKFYKDIEEVLKSYFDFLKMHQ